MSEKVLITGGAGFIGSYLADEYLKEGYSVRVLDNLTPQVHGKLFESKTPPAYLNKDVEFIFGDIQDREVVKSALQGVDILSHHAAAVGVGQSMHDIEYYTRVNTYGASVILDIIANEKTSVKKMLVASSMSIYGEGAYLKTSNNTLVYPNMRDAKQLKSRSWELVDSDGESLVPTATKETKPLAPPNIYAINKRDHEEMFLTIGRAYEIPTVAFRYFNVFGSRQSLSNPYTGVMAIFCSRILNGNHPIIFEDGKQMRDFVKVEDIAQANILATKSTSVDYDVFNIGSGKAITILDLTKIIANAMGVEFNPDILGKYRVGDIRHCFSDISKATDKLGYKPAFDVTSGIAEVIDWVGRQVADDSFDNMKSGLEKLGLVR
jgi:dTDP-L-rhamnose 4-epimerase